MINHIKKHGLFRKHDFDTIFSELYRIYKNNFFTFFLPVFFIHIIIQVPLFYKGFSSLQNLVYHEQHMEIPSVFWPYIIIFGIAALFIYSLIYLFITYYIIKKQEDEQLKVMDALSTSIKRYLLRYVVLLIAVGIIISVSAIAGVIVLIIGSLLAALYVGTNLFITGPALVAENTNPFESIGRGFILTHKDFWTTLGMVVTFILILILINFILSAIIAIPGAVVFVKEIFLSEGGIDSYSFSDISSLFNMGIIGIILSSAVNALILPLSPIFSVILYYRLRYIEEEARG